MTLSSSLNSTAQRTVDFFLHVNSNEILNDGISTEVEGDLAAQLMQASKTFVAEGVDPDTGQVDYATLKKGRAYDEFRFLARGLGNYRLECLGEGAAYSAFWINIYNAVIIDAIIQYEIQKSMMKKPGVFRQAAYSINGMRFSADDIEHGILRQNRPNPILPVRPFTSSDLRLRYIVKTFDPRIHFALVCGARSCPPIAYYGADRLDAQLNQAAGAFINGGGVRWDPERGTLWLSKILDWYEQDFGGKQAMLDLIQKHSQSEDIHNLPPLNELKLRYFPYDWRINHFGQG